jgi:hypothetical protein
MIWQFTTLNTAKMIIEIIGKVIAAIKYFIHPLPILEWNQKWNNRKFRDQMKISFVNISLLLYVLFKNRK